MRTWHLTYNTFVASKDRRETTPEEMQDDKRGIWVRDRLPDKKRRQNERSRCLSPCINISLHSYLRLWRQKHHTIFSWVQIPYHLWHFPHHSVEMKQSAKQDASLLNKSFTLISLNIFLTAFLSCVLCPKVHHICISTASFPIEGERSFLSPTDFYHILLPLFTFFFICSFFSTPSLSYSLLLHQSQADGAFIVIPNTCWTTTVFFLVLYSLQKTDIYSNEGMNPSSSWLGTEANDEQTVDMNHQRTHKC